MKTKPRHLLQIVLLLILIAPSGMPLVAAQPQPETSFTKDSGPNSAGTWEDTFADTSHLPSRFQTKVSGGALQLDFPGSTTVCVDSRDMEETPPYVGNPCVDFWDVRSWGRGGHVYVTLSAQTSGQSTNWGIFRPNLSRRGMYNIDAWIPSHTAYGFPCTSYNPQWDTENACYEVHYRGGVATRCRNQAPLFNQWLDIGTFEFESGTSGYVKLSDLTGEPLGSHYVVFDDICFALVEMGGTALSEEIPLPVASRWDRVNFTRSQPSGTYARVDIMAADGSTVLLSDVQDGTNLESIDPAVHPAIRLRARFNSTNPTSSATLDRWSVSWVNAPVWTFLVYLNGDNDLDDQTDDLFNKLERAADNPYVNILVLWDRHPGGTWDPATYRYEVQYDDNLAQLYPYTEGVNRWFLGELNMGDKQILADFISWAKANYAADNYFLSVMDHGGGWAPELSALRPTWIMGGAGLSWDDTDVDYLSTYDLGWSLDSMGPIDVVFYDACLMGMLENVYELGANADYLVASQNLAFATTPYDFYIGAITGTTTPAELASAVADNYIHSLLPGTSGSVSVLQLDATAGIATVVDALAQDLRSLLDSPDAREQIASAYVAAQKLDYDSDYILEPSRDGFVDLYDFAEQVTVFVSDTQVISSAQQLMAALDAGFVLYESHRDGYPYYTSTLAGLNGTSIYMPFGEELYIGAECISKTLDICAEQPYTDCLKLRQYYTTTVPPQESQLRFAQDTQWDEFIQSFVDLYYGCLSPTKQLEGVLPQVRPIHILHSHDQRAELIVLYAVYLPLTTQNHWGDDPIR